MYAAEDLLLHTSAEVTLIDRLPVAGGLIRYGVAPDHLSTKKAGDTFARFHTHPRVRMHLGLEVGRDITPEELAAHHDAVIYAVGAPAGRQLGIPGEDLPGSICATTFVSWYNAHPEVAADAVDVSAERVVVVGNGNVALDAARILVSDPGALAKGDIAHHALEALRAGSVREVVLLGRRGPEDAAYTASELLALKHLEGVELVVDDHDPRTGAAIDAATLETGPRCCGTRPGRRWTGRARRWRGAASCSASTPRRWRRSAGALSARSGSRTARGHERQGDPRRAAAAGRRAARTAAHRAAVRRGVGHRAARERPGGGPARDVRRGMDQARPLGGHRGQPDLRRRDRGHIAGRRRRRCAPGP